MSTRCALIVLSLLLPSQLDAQGPWRARPGASLPRAKVDSHGTASGDVDGDGDVDLVITHDRGVRLLLNDGGGGFSDGTSRRLSVPAVNYSGALLVDVDEDRDLDLFLTVWDRSSQNRLYLNLRDGTFADATGTHVPATQPSNLSAVAGDVDADGDVDVIVAQWSAKRGRGHVHLYRNQGAAASYRFALETLPVPRSYYRWPLLFDADGDRDPDLLLPRTNRPGWPEGMVYLENRRVGGRQVFVDVSATRLPAILRTGSMVRPSSGDVDGDGDLDMVVPRDMGRARQADRLYLALNDGNGSFAVVTDTRRFPPAGITRYPFLGLLADVDGDRDLDILDKGEGYAGDIWLNDGKGGFARAPSGSLSLPFDSWPEISLEMIDADLDGDLDLLYPGRHNHYDALHVNDGTGRFSAAGRPGASTSVSVLPREDNLPPDLLVTRTDDPLGNLRLLANDGYGGYADRTARRLPRITAGARRVRVADLNGDGVPDLYVAVTGTNRLLYGTNGGSFSEASWRVFSRFSTNSTDAVIADFDRDGAPEIFVANDNRQNRLYGNYFSGTFFWDRSRFALPQRSERSHAAAAADLDGDGLLDLAVANDGPNRVLAGDGSGNLRDRPGFPAIRESSRDVVAFDADGDRDVDLFFANHGQQNRLYLNDGQGRFTDVSAQNLPGRTERTRGIRAVDLDRDGDLDLVLAQDDVNRILLNDGKGVFRDAPLGFGLPATPTSDAAVLDWDQDGDPDAYLAHSSQADRLMDDLRHHLVRRGVPRRGSSITLDIHGRAGEVALLFASGRPAPPGKGIPLDAGMIQLDPRSAIHLAAGPIPGSNVAPFGIAIPDHPILRGLTVYFQSGFATPRAVAVTNLLRVTVR